MDLTEESVLPKSALIEAMSAVLQRTALQSLCQKRKRIDEIYDALLLNLMRAVIKQE